MGIVISIILAIASFFGFKQLKAYKEKKKRAEQEIQWRKEEEARRKAEKERRAKLTPEQLKAEDERNKIAEVRYKIEECVDRINDHKDVIRVQEARGGKGSSYEVIHEFEQAIIAAKKELTELMEELESLGDKVIITETRYAMICMDPL